jgi:predicted ATPase
VGRQGWDYSGLGFGVAGARGGGDRANKTESIDFEADWGTPGPALLPFLLAQAYRYGGQAEKGLSIMNEALAIMEKVGEYLWEADLVRCLGDLHQHSSGGNKVEEHYLKAREIARHRGLRLPELRAAKSLVRLWQAQDRSKEMEARRILQSIYSCFEEGFDAPDLKEARELLGVPS